MEICNLTRFCVSGGRKKHRDTQKVHHLMEAKINCRISVNNQIMLI